MLDQIGKPQKQQEQPQTTKRITEQLMNACFPHLSGAINWECRADRTGIVHVQFGKASKGIQGIGGVFLA
jgi:hypothetical protein